MSALATKPRAVSAREEEILAAAARIFREKGYHGASVRDIAESVGLLKGSLYHYIRSKEELLARLFEGALEDTVDDLERIASRKGTPRGSTSSLNTGIASGSRCACRCESMWVGPRPMSRWNSAS